MKLLRSQVSSIADALLNMDGDPKKPNKYSAKTRYSLAKNLRILSGRVEDFDKVRIGLIREIAPEDFAVKAGPQMVEFTTKWELFLKGTDAEPASEEIDGLMKFTLADLNLDSNEIPIAVLAKLGPILIED